MKSFRISRQFCIYLLRNDFTYMHDDPTSIQLYVCIWFYIYLSRSASQEEHVEWASLPIE